MFLFFFFRSYGVALAYNLQDTFNKRCVDKGKIKAEFTDGCGFTHKHLCAPDFKGTVTGGKHCSVHVGANEHTVGKTDGHFETKLTLL